MPRVKKVATIKKPIKKTTTPKLKPKVIKKPSARVNLSIPFFSLTGRSAGTLTLPKEIFGKEVNKKLLTQALRVYMTNQKSFTASTKTRGKVEGSSVKIYRQKGTGKARHGSIRAPIFVGGGIVFGPQSRNVRLDLPRKMKKAALLSALSSKAIEKNVIALTGLDKASGKTKEFVELLKKINFKSNSALIVTDKKTDNVVRAVKNIPNIDALPASLVNAYEILRHEFLFITKDAIEKFNTK